MPDAVCTVTLAVKPEGNPGVNVNMIVVDEPDGRDMGRVGAEIPPTELNGLPLMKMSVIVASSEPVFLALSTITSVLFAYALVISSFSNFVNSSVLVTVIVRVCVVVVTVVI